MQRDATSPLTSRFLTLRKARLEARERFLAGRLAEKQYAIRLRQVAKHVGELVRGMAPDGLVTDVAALISILNRYGETLKPWAESVASRMIEDVSRRDATAWEKHGKAIGQALRKEINSAPTGHAFRTSLAEQVTKITSLPREAAERVYRLTSEALPTGRRAADIAQEILNSGEVTKSSAMMLARTGVSSTATQLTKSRALFIGSEGYFWRTSKDAAVRPSHRKMEGVFVRWDSPPTLDGFQGHCGEYANCRCFPEPVIPDRYGVSGATAA